VTRVGVVFGGVSAEREVSIVSARTILGGFPRERYEAIPIAVDPSGCFRDDADSRVILANGFDAVVPAAGRLPPARFEGIDVAFPIVHGETGEDGTLQGFFETLGIPYAGSDVASSALGMNKAAFKARMRDAGVPVVRSVAVGRAEWDERAGSVADAIARRLPLPLFVKPSGGGSSLGVTKVKEWDGLRGAVEAAFVYDRTILVEEGIDAREIECAVLGNDAPEASGCGEIVPGREFYDYDDKYVTDGARLLVPAPLEDAVPAEVRALADPQVKAVLEGVEATDRQLLQTLERYGVKAVDTSDGKFDPNLHQAIAEVPGNGKPAGSIVDVVQAGFMIGERLLRPAMVTVAKKDVPAQPVSVDTKV